MLVIYAIVNVRILVWSKLVSILGSMVFLFFILALVLRVSVLCKLALWISELDRQRLNLANT